MRQYKPRWESDPTGQRLHVTIIDADYATSDEKTKLRIKSLTDACRPILSAMANSFVGVAQFQAFSNRKHPAGGKTVSLHVHATLEGHDILANAEQVARRCNLRMSAGDDGCDAVRVQLIGPAWIDLARVLRYPHKGPDRNKNDYVNPRTGSRNINESEKSDRFVRYLRQYQLLSMVERDHLMFASGEGVPIKNRALRAVHDQLTTRTEWGRRAEQMKWVEEFWAGFMPRIGLHRFEMPEVGLRLH